MTDGSIILDQIEKRNADRISTEGDLGKLRLTKVILTDKLAFDQFNKVLKGVKEKFLDKCFLVTHDFKVLIYAIRLLCDRHRVSMSDIIAEAWEAMKLDEEQEKVLTQRLNKQNGDIEGQQKLFGKDQNGKKGKNGKVKDDGSTAEPASEVKTEKLKAVK